MINYYYPFDSSFRSGFTGGNPVLEVKQNAAVTPAQIAELTANGMAVSSSSVLHFDEGVPNPMHFPLEQSRGVDVVDVWNASESSKRKLNAFAKSQSKSMPSTSVSD